MTGSAAKFSSGLSSMKECWVSCAGFLVGCFVTGISATGHFMGCPPAFAISVEGLSETGSSEGTLEADCFVGPSVADFGAGFFVGLSPDSAECSFAGLPVTGLRVG